jgi:hypothetical protein
VGEEGEEEAYVFNLIPLANQGDSPGQKVLARSYNRSLQLQARPDTRTEFKISQRPLKGGG